jgi:hypothetical protein
MYGQLCPARCDRSGKGQPALRRCGRCVGCPGRGSPLAVQHPVEDLLGEILIYTLGRRHCLPDVLPHACQCRLRVLVARDAPRPAGQPPAGGNATLRHNRARPRTNAMRTRREARKPVRPIPRRRSPRSTPQVPAPGHLCPTVAASGEEPAARYVHSKTRDALVLTMLVGDGRTARGAGGCAPASPCAHLENRFQV